VWGWSQKKRTRKTAKSKGGTWVSMYTHGTARILLDGKGGNQEEGEDKKLKRERGRKGGVFLKEKFGRRGKLQNQKKKGKQRRYSQEEEWKRSHSSGEKTEARGVFNVRKGER